MKEDSINAITMRATEPSFCHEKTCYKAEGHMKCHNFPKDTSRSYRHNPGASESNGIFVNTSFKCIVIC